jgi:hypothetical protein
MIETTLTSQDVARRRGVTRRIASAWLRNNRIQAVNPGARPARYRLADIEAAEGERRPPEDVADIGELARRFGVLRAALASRITQSRHSKRPCPPPAGRWRTTSGQLADHYPIDAVTRWWNAGSRRPRPGANEALTGLRERVAQRHGTERCWRSGCPCPVCASARASVRQLERDSRRRIDVAIERLVGAALTPDTDLGRLATVATALHNPIRVDMLRMVAIYYPDPAPVAAIETHLGVDNGPAHWQILREAGLITSQATADGSAGARYAL